jgi:hypothetical protein
MLKFITVLSLIAYYFFNSSYVKAERSLGATQLGRSHISVLSPPSLSPLRDSSRSRLRQLEEHMLRNGSDTSSQKWGIFWTRKSKKNEESGCLLNYILSIPSNIISSVLPYGIIGTLFNAVD